MKKVFTFFLAMAIIFGISGCGKKEYIVFPFSASDVVKIETLNKMVINLISLFFI